MKLTQHTGFSLRVFMYLAEDDGCRITENCKLKHVLGSATSAFNTLLDNYTLADFVISEHEKAVQVMARSSESRL